MIASAWRERRLNEPDDDWTTCLLDDAPIFPVSKLLDSHFGCWPVDLVVGQFCLVEAIRWVVGVGWMQVIRAGSLGAGGGCCCSWEC